MSSPAELSSPEEMSIPEELLGLDELSKSWKMIEVTGIAQVLTNCWSPEEMWKS